MSPLIFLPTNFKQRRGSRLTKSKLKSSPLSNLLSNIVLHLFGRTKIFGPLWIVSLPDIFDELLYSGFWEYPFWGLNCFKLLDIVLLFSIDDIALYASPFILAFFIFEKRFSYISIFWQ